MDSSFLMPKISAKFHRGHPNRGTKERRGTFKSVIFDPYLSISQQEAQLLQRLRDGLC